MRLYNGIELPGQWPPNEPAPDRITTMPVPYLRNKPSVIPIDTGRQLFVDSFLIQETNMSFVHHKAIYYNENPVLKADKPWELTSDGYEYAAPFSDGVWYDEKYNKFRMWYLAGGAYTSDVKHALCTCYAESDDGIYWEKPLLDIIPGTNIVDIENRDAATIWIDRQENDPEKRYKMFLIQYEPDYIQWQYIIKYSADGLHWGKATSQSGAVSDRSTAFYNPFRKKWCLSMRHHIEDVSWRCRTYLEHDCPEDAIALAHRLRNKHHDKHVVFWFTPDENEKRRLDFPDSEPGIYNFDAIAYESLMLGIYSQWQGPENNICKANMNPKHNEIQLGYSRDGFHFSRPFLEAFAPVDHKDGAWNYGNMQSVNGTPIITEDKLYFYFSGRKKNDAWWDAGMSTGLAFLRRDGFVSLSTEGMGSIRTELLTFSGEYLFVNASVHGEIRIAVLDDRGNEVDGFTQTDSIPMIGNSTKHHMKWKNHDSLKGFIGRKVRFLFIVAKGEIFSFWVSKTTCGKSGGYTAGGGPDLSPTGQDI